MTRIFQQFYELSSSHGRGLETWAWNLGLELGKSSDVLPRRGAYWDLRTVTMCVDS